MQNYGFASDPLVGSIPPSRLAPCHLPLHKGGFWPGACSDVVLSGEILPISSLKSDNRNTAVPRPPCVKGAVTVGDWGIVSGGELGNLRILQQALDHGKPPAALSNGEPPGVFSFKSLAEFAPPGCEKLKSGILPGHTHGKIHFSPCKCEFGRPWRSNFARSRVQTARKILVFFEHSFRSGTAAAPPGADRDGSG